jgi:hypothetical protein
MDTRLPLILILGLWLLPAAAACGGGAAHAAASPPARPTPSQAALPAGDPSPSPSAQPAPAPPQPLVIVRSPNAMVAAATPDGAFVWSFDPGSLGIANPTLVTSGPDLLAYGGGKVSVIDRSGNVIGHGTSAAGAQLLPAPTGRSWAWTTRDSTAEPPAPQVSSLWVAGIGQSPTRVKTWTGPYSMSGRQWSDAGIVVVAIGPNCGGEPESSSLVDPASGAETALFGAGRWPLDVRAGLAVAKSVDGGALYVTGAAQIARSYPLPVAGAGVAPAGGRLFVSTFGEGGCGGVPRAATIVIEVASTSQTTIDGFFADAWLDDQHLLGRSPLAQPANGSIWGTDVQLADVSGHVSDLVAGTLVGVLRP